MRRMLALGCLLFLFASALVPVAQAGFDLKNTTPRTPGPAVQGGEDKTAVFNLISNPSFENSTFAPWVRIVNGAGIWVPTGALVGPLSGLPVAPPVAGAQQALYDQSAEADGILYQDVTIPNTATATLSLFLWYENYAGFFLIPPTLDHTLVPNQQLRIDLMDPAFPPDDVGAGVLQPLFQTNAASPNALPPTPFSWNVSAFAGQTVRVRIAVVNNQDFLLAGVDRVVLEGQVECVWATASSPNQDQVSVYTVPDGSGSTLNNAQLFGGAPTNAIVDVVLRDAFGAPIVGYPREGVSLITTQGGLSHCAGWNIADVDTDVAGGTFFRDPRLAGGHTDPSSERTLVQVDDLVGGTLRHLELQGVFRNVAASSDIPCGTNVCTSDKPDNNAGLYMEQVTCSAVGAVESLQESNLSVSATGLWASGQGFVNLFTQDPNERQAGSSVFDFEFDLRSFAQVTARWDLQTTSTLGTAEIQLIDGGGNVVFSDVANSSSTFDGKIQPGFYTFRVSTRVDVCANPGLQEFASWDFDLDVVTGEMLYNPRFLGSDSGGRIFSVDPTTAAAVFVCALPWADGSTEIEFDHLSQAAYAFGTGASTQIVRFDPATCVQGAPVPTGLRFQGLEFANGVLYGAGVPGICDPSMLYILDPNTGISTPIGPTGFGPISGLAWDPHHKIMYGITGCTAVFGQSNLLRIDLHTGAASLIGNIGLPLGSLEFGPDGRLYAGGSPNAGGRIWVLDPLSGAPTFVGNTGFASVTGLALVSDLGLDIQFNSPDITGNGIVNLADVGPFSADLVGPYEYRSDYFWDGVIDLADIGPFSGAIGASCLPPPPPKAPVVNADGQRDLLTVAFDAVGTSDARLSPGESAEAHLLLSGPAAEKGIDAWEAGVSVSDNVVIEEWVLPRGSHNFAKGGDLIVGTGGMRAANEGEFLTLATVRFHVTDDAPATFRVGGSSLGSVGKVPAVSMAQRRDTLKPLFVAANSDGVAATLNGTRGDGPASLRAELELRNAPNPFNPATTIHFNLPREGRIAVSIFDAAGRRVRLLEGGVLQAGAASLQWDGTDDAGAGVGSGMFYARLALDGEFLGQTIKMALVK